MAGIGSSLISGSVTIVGATTPKVYNVSCPLAGTEYSQALSAGTVRYTLRSRGGGKIQYSFTLGASGTTYITVMPGCSESEDGLSLTGKTLYFQSSKASDTIEIKEWT